MTGDIPLPNGFCEDSKGDFVRTFNLYGIRFDVIAHLPAEPDAGIYLSFIADTMREGREISGETYYTTDFDHDKLRTAREVAERLGEKLPGNLRLTAHPGSSFAIFTSHIDSLAGPLSLKDLHALTDVLANAERGWEEGHEPLGRIEGVTPTLGGSQAWSARIEQPAPPLSDNAKVDIASLFACLFPTATPETRAHAVREVAEIVDRDRAAARQRGGHQP